MERVVLQSAGLMRSRKAGGASSVKNRRAGVDEEKWIAGSRNTLERSVVCRRRRTFAGLRQSRHACDWIRMLFGHSNCGPRCGQSQAIPALPHQCVSERETQLVEGAARNAR